MTPRRCLSSIAEAKFSEFVAVRVRVHNLPPGTIVSFELAVGVLAGWLIAVKPDTCWPMIRGSHALPPETFSYYGPKRTRSSLSMAMWGGPLFERVGAACSLSKRPRTLPRRAGPYARRCGATSAEAGNILTLRSPAYQRAERQSRCGRNNIDGGFQHRQPLATSRAPVRK